MSFAAADIEHILAGRVLSIQQPYAWLIVSGQKDIENRTWSTPYRGPLLIHAGKQHYGGVVSSREDVEAHGDVFAYGAIVGACELVDCVTWSDSEWFNGPFGFVVRNQLAFREPVPMKGRLGLFPLPGQIKPAVREKLRLALEK